MQLYASKSERNAKYDQLRFVRRDGSASTTMMPRQGVLPTVQQGGGAAALYQAVLALSQRWLAVPFYATLELDMPAL